MDLDTVGSTPQKNYSPIKVEYQGIGRAVFNNPWGVVEGLVEIIYDESGESNIVMQVQRVFIGQSSQDPFIGSLLLLSGKNPPEPGEQVSFGLLEIFNNRCIELAVKTSEGIFLATKEVKYSYKQIFTNNRNLIQLRFQTLGAYYLVDKAEEVKYWRLPLTNFISKFNKAIYELNFDPLNFLLNEASQDHIITFEFDGGLGLIAPLESYTTRKKILESGQTHRLITANMIGVIGQKTEDLFEVEEWFPAKLLSVLSLAIGIEVGSPWLDLLDEKGKLAVRVHSRFGYPVFSLGHVAIDDFMHDGISELISKFQALVDPNLPNLTVLLRHLVRAGLHNLPIEDNFDHLFRAFEGLCTHYGISTQTLTNSLSQSQQREVNATLRTAAQQIQKASQEASAAGEVEQVRILQRIASRVTNVTNIDKSFGLAILDLLKQFHLPDANIVDNYYQIKPRLDGRNWFAVLSDYRGATIHEGYFDFQGKSYDIEDVLRIMQHLHDILLRIAFKLVGYTKTYNSPIPAAGPIQPVDWVNTSLSAIKLGY